MIVGLLALGLGTWVAVISVRFLRSGRKAFDRYLSVTDIPPVHKSPVGSPHTQWETKGTRNFRGPGTGI